MKRYQSQIPKEYSPPSSRGHSFSDSQNLNNFIAIRKLKEADSQLDLMKRRLSALKIKEEKNYRKSECALKKMKYHQMVQDLQQKQREKKKLHKIETQQKLDYQRKMNSSQRCSRAQKLREVRDLFHKAKQNQYLSQKQASSMIDSRIRQQSSVDMDNKREKKLMIQDYEQQSRRNYQIYMLQKQNSIRNYKETEQSRMIQMKEKRELEMRDMIRMQLQMLERESRSRQAAEVTNRQLNKMVSKPRLNHKKIPATSRQQIKNPELFHE